MPITLSELYRQNPDHFVPVGTEVIVPDGISRLNPGVTWGAYQREFAVAYPGAVGISQATADLLATMPSVPTAYLGNGQGVLAPGAIDAGRQVQHIIATDAGNPGPGLFGPLAILALGAIAAWAVLR